MASTSSDAAPSRGNRNEYEFTLEDGSKLTVKLNKKDKIRRWFYSEKEFEARVLKKKEKLEKRTRQQKATEVSPEQQQEPVEGSPSDDPPENEKKSVVEPSLGPNAFGAASGILMDQRLIQKSEDEPSFSERQ